MSYLEPLCLWQDLSVVYIGKRDTIPQLICLVEIQHFFQICSSSMESEINDTKFAGLPCASLVNLFRGTRSVSVSPILSGWGSKSFKVQIYFEKDIRFCFTKGFLLKKICMCPFPSSCFKILLSMQKCLCPWQIIFYISFTFMCGANKSYFFHLYETDSFSWFFVVSLLFLVHFATNGAIFVLPHTHTDMFTHTSIHKLQ